MGSIPQRRSRNWRSLAALAAGGVLITATACSTPEAGGGGEDGGKEGPFTIGVSNGFIGSEWREQMLATLQKDFDEYKSDGVVDELVVESADVDVNGQIKQIRNLIKSDVDAIIVNPNSPTALDKVFGEAADQGIKIVAIDQAVESKDVTNVVIDQGEWASISAEWLAEEVGDGGEIIAVNGIDGHPANEARWEGAKKVFDDAGVKVAANDYGNWDQATGQQVTKDLLASHPDVDGIFVQDGMALGAFQALESEKKVGDIAITGEARVGFMKRWQEQREGDGDFTSIGVPNPPSVSVSALHVVVRMLEGKKFGDSLEGNSVYLPIPETVTDENFDEQFDAVKDEPDTYAVDHSVTAKEADDYFQ
ncbi:monosaccharide ABC transporter substrate-binding protein (CUT2 family) [Murinocardiopsis flavida]|uniref:Monosaccharide ABC transporter substrate-binding protein (CUT2 family) n=1 Tax=Murinocardiopsis flavida TaxID=645275 RepID=A0A2P8DGZ9_9ACTN|nr:ABC transporter substrate-binding protein [Murinocardiopsis flavida]PSK96494.1 monosaccharide ABC transporter substrate-binding protein (CUT2 family) [Murinocardiopsis flavida]